MLVSWISTIIKSVCEWLKKKGKKKKIPVKAYEEIVSQLDEAYTEKAEVEKKWGTGRASEPEWERTGY